jgi:hypothetical protein
MNYPNWNPASKKPEDEYCSKWCLVQFENGFADTALWGETRAWYLNGRQINDKVVAWMPLPPVYEPKPTDRKFEWHGANETPPTPGEYLTWFSWVDAPAGPDVRLWTGEKWSDIDTSMYPNDDCGEGVLFWAAVPIPDVR